jgi:PAS domain S-box-containing protein
MSNRRQKSATAAAVIQTLGAAVVILDLEGRVTFFNHSAEVYSGYQSHEVLGKRIWDFLIDPEDVDNVHQAFKNLKDFGLPTQMETVWVTRDKKKRIMEWSNSPAADESGGLKWIVDTYVDITQFRETQRELENAKKALEQAVRTRDDFISIASHELRTPLTSLRLQVQLLISLPGIHSVSPMVSKLLEGADQQIGRMSGLIWDMLDSVSISLGKLRLKTEDGELVSQVKNIIAQLDGVISRSQVHIELNAPAPVRGRWDKSRIEQAILNLLTNAIKYGMGKPIQVRVKERANRAIVEVEDHGPGIPQAEQAEIFDQFVQGRTNGKGGLGLGLFISKKIATVHDGELRVQSEPGHGSTFILDFPLHTNNRADQGIRFAS